MKLYTHTHTHTHTIFLQKNCWTVWRERELQFKEENGRKETKGGCRKSNLCQQKELLDSLERESRSLVKINFIFDAKKSGKNRAKNDIDNSKKLIKEAMKKWINKKDGLLYGKLESTRLSSYKPYNSLSFL